MKTLHTLVVDDNDINRLILDRTIASFGATVDHARNGQEAIDKLADGAFDVVFMDIAMPVMNGIDATTHLRARGVDVTVIAVTAHFDRADAPELVAAGFDGLITKPFAVAVVFDWLRRLETDLGAVGGAARA